MNDTQKEVGSFLWFTVYMHCHS